jgi:hypothetical protein
MRMHWLRLPVAYALARCVGSQGFGAVRGAEVQDLDKAGGVDGAVPRRHQAQVVLDQVEHRRRRQQLLLPIACPHQDALPEDLGRADGACSSSEAWVWWPRTRQGTCTPLATPHATRSKCRDIISCRHISLSPNTNKHNNVHREEIKARDDAEVGERNCDGDGENLLAGFVYALCVPEIESETKRNVVDFPEPRSRCNAWANGGEANACACNVIDPCQTRFLRSLTVHWISTCTTSGAGRTDAAVRPGRMISFFPEIQTRWPTCAADVNVKQQPKKRGRGGSRASAAAKEDDQVKTRPPAPATEEETAPVSLQSYETQEPNEQDTAMAEEEDTGGKKKRRHRQDEDHPQPETPRVARHAGARHDDGRHVRAPDQGDRPDDAHLTRGAERRAARAPRRTREARHLGGGQGRIHVHGRLVCS